MTFDFTLQGVIKKNNMSKLMAATVFHDALHMVAPPPRHYKACPGRLDTSKCIIMIIPSKFS